MEIEENFRKETPEPDLVPIVDCLVSVIFFLLFSTTFIELTKIMIPPASIAQTSVSDNKIPLSPKLYIDVNGANLDITLIWNGENPGSIKRSVHREDSKTASIALQEKVKEMSDEFKKNHKTEKSLQIALSNEANYQELITVMDGLIKSDKSLDIVLMSPDEVENKDVH